MSSAFSASALVLLLQQPTGEPLCAGRIDGTIVPTEFVGARVFARWRVNGDGDLRLYTDTGGGLLSLFPDVIQRLHLSVDTTRWMRGTTEIKRMMARVPRTRLDSQFPSLPDSDSGSFGLLVEQNPVPDEEPGHAWDGRLGTQWFADRVWAIDYPRRRLTFNGAAPTGPTSAECWVALGFRVDSTGHRVNSFPRITVRIDGDSVDLLLDTGATTQLTSAAHAQIEPDEPIHRAASFIAASRFQRWHMRHPDWPIAVAAEEDTHFDMIRVPTIQVGSATIGPVWFTQRPDANFRDFMSQYMDKPVEGALGGSAWRYATLILDYPRSRAAVVLPPSR